MKNTGLPPTATVLEIRTHGVSGTPAEQILADPVGPLPPGDLVDVPGPLGPGRRFVRRVDGDRNDVPVAGSDSHFAWAYSWGRLTSGGFVKSLWAVLIPFALVNMAYAMISDDRRRLGSPVSTRVCRILVHLLGVALTVLFTLQITYVIVDSVAYRCIAASDGTCMEHVPYVDRLRDHPLTISLLAVALVLAVLTIGGLITRFSATDSEGTLREVVDQANASAAQTADDPATDDPAMATADLVDGNIAAPILRTVHGIAAPTAVLTLLLSMRPADSGEWRWIVQVAVFGVLAATIATIDLCGPVRVARWFAAHPQAHLQFSIIGGAVMTGAHVSAIVVAATVLPSSFDVEASAKLPDTLLPDAWSPIEATLVISAALCLLMVLALLGPGRALAVRARDYPKAYRPWLRGFTPAIVGGLALIIGSGFGVGAARSFDALANNDIGGADPMPTRTSYDIISTQWGLLGMLVAAALVAGALVLVALSFVPVPVVDRLDPLPKDSGLWTLRWHRWRTEWRHRIATLNRGTPCLLAAFLISAVGCGAAGVWAAVPESAVTAFAAPSWLREQCLRATGTWILIALVAGLAFVIRQAIANPGGMGRTLGVLWDVSSFWPREGHPVVPPPYAPTAVADIVERVQDIRASSPDVMIVLCGHSQGSLIMYAAALQLRRRDVTDQIDLLDRVSLLTYGSQLRWLYGQAFPAFLNVDSHRELADALGGRWINLIRFTDPVGGPVLSWDLTASGQGICASVLDAPVASGWSRIQVLGPHDGVLVAGGERWLVDPPPLIEYDFKRGHSNYMREAAWVDAITELTRQTARGQADRTEHPD